MKNIVMHMPIPASYESGFLLFEIFNSLFPNNDPIQALEID
jgi:hypothetical protein